jgi:polar amino acid transport system substrate-binding protein
MKRAFPSLLPLLLAVGACAAPRAGLGAADTAETLVVGSDLDNAPFAYVGANGKPAGRDVEMMAMLAERLGLELEWRRMPFEALLDACERGDVDVVCATLGITPERAERVLFTEPYFSTSIAVVTRAGAGEPQALADLDGRRVAAGAGTTSERAVRSRLPAALGVFENKTGLDAAARLAAREVDAVVLDGPAADALVAASGGRLRRLAEALAAERYALALPPDRPLLRGTLERGLRELDGEWKRLDARHGLRGR